MSGVTRLGDTYGTVNIDLTGIRDATGPPRLPDMVEGCSNRSFETWNAARGKS
jgi:hypothetical protein